ncbi:MAG: hypothetical protein R3F11_15580 [Verrucomicrobiales bacterium]
MIEDKLELVTRYQFADSDGADEYMRAEPLRARGRTSRTAVAATNTTPSTASANYYILDHRLREADDRRQYVLDGGGDGGDYAGWTWVSGIRMYW